VLRAGGYGRVAIIALIKAALLSNRYVEILSFAPRETLGRLRRRAGPRARGSGRSANECLLERAVPEPGRFDGRAVSASADGRRLGPLPELGLENLVDIHPNPADAALIDLDLVQIRGRMGVSLRRAPVVLPEIGAQAVV
jgi:hypothetical protein